MSADECTCYGRVMCPYCAARHEVNAALDEFRDEAWQWKGDDDRRNAG